MAKEIVKQNGFDLTQDKIDLIRKTIAKDATDQELQMFIHMCKTYELDPILKELIFIKRQVWNNFKKGYDMVPTMMVSRDGLLAIAHKSGQFDGMETNALYEDKKLIGAECTVWNKSCTHAIKQKVLFQEYCVINHKTGAAQALWGSKPTTMICKVAEAQALRKAFNIKGIYIQEEISQEIAKEATGDLAAGAAQLAISETMYKDADQYEDWSVDLLTKMLDALKEQTTVDGVRGWERQHQKDLGMLNDSDRQYARTSIDSRLECLVQGREWAMPAMVAGGTTEPPQAANAKPAPIESPDAVFEKQAADDKTWLKAEVPDLMDIKTKLLLKRWLEIRTHRLKEMLPEYNTQAKAYFNTQWKSATGTDQLQYVWPQV